MDLDLAQDTGALTQDALTLETLSVCLSAFIGELANTSMPLPVSIHKSVSEYL